MITIRQAVADDFFKGHIDLYRQLSNTINSISEEQYRYVIESQSDSHSIFVIEEKNRIVGSITLLIEQKFIHNYGKVCRIEDVVVDERFRNRKYGKALIEFAKQYAQNNKCYKVILHCNEINKPFYERCGFSENSSLMAIYLSE